MKKIVGFGMLAFCVIAVTQQEASAWIHSNFRAGVNWDWTAANNSILWGCWRDGQVPAPTGFGSGVPVPTFGPVQPFMASQGFAPQGSFDPSHAQVNYPAPFQFANYPRPVYYYYYPNTGYGR
jgi:hypothetical protein